MSSGDPLINTKKSFDPVSDSNTAILILGSLPGDKSIEVGEYCGRREYRKALQLSKGMWMVPLLG